MLYFCVRETAILWLLKLLKRNSFSIEFFSDLYQHYAMFLLMFNFLIIWKQEKKKCFKSKKFLFKLFFSIPIQQFLLWKTLKTLIIPIERRQLWNFVLYIRSNVSIFKDELSLLSIPSSSSYLFSSFSINYSFSR